MSLSLFLILDCFDGAVVGYAMRTHMRVSLCCDMFRDAVSRYGYQPGLILHSDHGSQYTSQEYCTHCYFDNARMESFFVTQGIVKLSATGIEFEVPQFLSRMEVKSFARSGVNQRQISF